MAWRRRRQLRCGSTPPEPSGILGTDIRRGFRSSFYCGETTLFPERVRIRRLIRFVQKRRPPTSSQGGTNQTKVHSGDNLLGERGFVRSGDHLIPISGGGQNQTKVQQRRDQLIFLLLGTRISRGFTQRREIAIYGLFQTMDGKFTVGGQLISDNWSRTNFVARQCDLFQFFPLSALLAVVFLWLSRRKGKRTLNNLFIGPKAATAYQAVHGNRPKNTE